MFWNKKNDNTRASLNNPDDYDRTNKRITDLAARLELLETKFALFKTDYENLRGKFNRKLSGLAAEETKEKAQDFNSRDEIYMG